MGATLETGFSGRGLSFFGLSSSKVIEGTCTVSEALAQAGMDWEVEKIPAGYAGFEGEFVEAGAKFNLTRRQDTGAILGQVGAQYTVFNNQQAFEFADNLLDHGAEFHAAGSYNGGANTFLVAKLPESITVAGEDDMTLYLQMVNSHDGSGSIAAYVTPIRIQCTNQFRLAMAKAVSSIKLRHTKSSEERIEQAAKTLNLVSQYKSDLEEGIAQLQATAMEIEEVEAFFKELTGSPRVQERLLENYNTSETVTRGTAFGVINSVTECLQFNPARNTSMDTRFSSILDGPVQRLTEKASQRLLRVR